MTVRSLVIDVALNTAFIALNLGILIAFNPAASQLSPDTSDGALVCESSVRAYLIGQLVLYIVYSLPQKPLVYYIDWYNPEARRSRAVSLLWTLWSLLTLFDILWFFIGQYWVFGASICKTHDAPLYWLAVAQIAYFYLSTIVPIFIYAILVFFARRRYLRQQQGGGTGPAAHLKGGLSKAELATLRTFIFKTSMAVSPEENDEEAQISKRDAQEASSPIEMSLFGAVHELVGASGNATTASSTPISILESVVSTTEPPPQDDKGKSPVYLTPDSKTSSTGSKSKPSPASESLSVIPASGDVSKAPSPVESDLPSGASTNCAICFCDFEAGEVIRELACLHIFHVDCIDPWLIVQEADASKTPSSSTITKAHRTCPLCVREAVLPEFRDKDVELAMELQKEEEAEMARLLERLKKEAEDEQRLIERRKERKERRANGGGGGGGGGFGLFLGRGRSRTADPYGSSPSPSAVDPKRSTSVTSPKALKVEPEIPVAVASPEHAADEVTGSSESSMTNKSPQERLSSMKKRLSNIQSRLVDSQFTDLEAQASAKAIGDYIEVVQLELEEEENRVLLEALDTLKIDAPHALDETSEERTDDSI
ncbi:hypothetical protein HDU98_004725 [Podochytrium sp. JEL0797]|nr:hypothetical protein HDU98_004725 [Podochytrium sp. JEL0797]